MKLKIILLAVFAAGLTASIAIAKPPPGHGRPNGQAGTTAASTTTGGTTTAGATTTGSTTTTSAAPGKVLVCHKTGNGHYVLIMVSARSAPAKGKHKGDVLAVNGACPGPLQGHDGSTTTGTITTGTTTTP